MARCDRVLTGSCRIAKNGSYEKILAMKAASRIAAVIRGLAAIACASLGTAAVVAQPGSAAVVRGIDAEVAGRVANVLAFTDIEHYAVYRGDDPTHPAAQMTARDSYEKDHGKTYTILKQSGSGVVLHYGLHPLLEHEKEINQPGKVDESWFTSANYEMKLKPGGVEKVNGRPCYALAIKPKHDAPNMIDGTLWVDTRDYTIVRVQGVASKRPSIFAGTTQMMRDYENIDGYPMATHARAESDSFLFGRYAVVIDYSDYRLQVRSAK